MNMFEKAIRIAKLAHQGQKRKYTHEPYLTHPFAVAGLVASVTYDEDMIIAAMLHDVVEDSEINIYEIRNIFGDYIATLVDEVTDKTILSDGNRTKRRRIDRAIINEACAEAKTIKLADVIDNLKTVIVHDKGFAKIYMEEKEELLLVLTEGDKTLFEVASNIIKEFKESIEE